MEATVIVPVRDGARTLPGLLESLAAQTLGAERFEVVVVDNGSRDGSGEVARRQGATVVDEPVVGRARARNRGAGVARAPLLAFVDADCRAEPAWLARLCSCLERAPLAAGPVRLLTGAPPGAVERFEALWRFRQEEHVRDAGWAASANLGVRREAFETVGGFDEAYRRIGEDVDLCLRAGRAGLDLAFCPDAAVSHPAEATLRAILRRGAAHGWSNLQLDRRLGAGRAYWRRPGPLVRGDWALRRFGVDPGELEPAERRRMAALGRAEYGARMAGSAWAALRRVS